jgi:hypothetical protein
MVHAAALIPAVSLLLMIFMKAVSLFMRLGKIKQD